jgi:hypothetical protein
MANVVQHQHKCGDIRHLFMRDPELTEQGVQSSISCQSEAPDVDIVLSSELIRAIQTALWTYPKRFIHIVPFLNELGTGLDNLPRKLEEQKQILEKDYYRVIFTEDSHEESFIVYLQKYIIPRFKSKTLLKIAIFTHSRFMKKHLNMQLTDLPNNVKITKEYDI